MVQDVPECSSRDQRENDRESEQPGESELLVALGVPDSPKNHSQTRNRKSTPRQRIGTIDWKLFGSYAF